MKTNYGDTQIEALILRHHPGAKEIQMLSGGLVSQTFSFSSEGKKHLFQIGGKRAAYEKERYVGETYKGRLPVRVVHGIYENADGRAYCFSDYIKGRRLFDLDGQQQIEAVPSVLALLEKIASTEIPGHLGYGQFDSSGQARFSSWQDFVSAVYREDVFDWKRRNAQKVDLDVVEDAIAILKKNMDLLKIRRAYLLHGDMGSSNLLVDGTRACGAIDWSLALYGDPLYEAANFMFWNEDKLQPLIAAVKAKHQKDELDTVRLHCYCIRIGLEEIYNTAVLGEIGYEDRWVMNRIKELTVRL